MDLIKELQWRGMIHDMMPGTEEQLRKEPTTVYMGIDPTADSLHIGHLAAIVLLRHFQQAGHKPLLVIGGATGMIGDPSGKSAERNLLTQETINYNMEKIKIQLSRLLDFSDSSNGAMILNNYDWMGKFSFLGFIREIGKHITVNYMIAKDSVKKRLETGLSFTEFTYQLVQGYDFYYLFTEYHCKLQIGGADQWGNIVTGTELIRRKNGGEGYALTCPLITRSDGGKFGKTEEGNVWLDSGYTTVFKFYQFWLNVSDEDAEKYLKVFTFLSAAEIKYLSEQHSKQPEKRIMQRTLANEITSMVHGADECIKAQSATDALFSKDALESLQTLDGSTLLDLFSGVPVYEVAAEKINKGIGVVDLLSVEAPVFASKSEARRMIENSGLSINREKITGVNAIVNGNNLISGKYLLVQKGKKLYFLIKVK